MNGTNDQSFFKTDIIRAFFRRLAEETRVHRLCDWDGTPGLILRQDVDLDLAPARAFANMQMECGIRSTFCIMTTSPTYNCQSPENRKILRSLVEDGFEIALHLDASFESDTLSTRADLEAKILEAASGGRVCSVSLHAPSATGEYPLLPGFRNAYDPAIFEPGRYVSDSRMTFKESPWKLLERSKTQIVQLLLHPMHYTVKGGGYDQILKTYLGRYFSTVDQYFRFSNDTYNKDIPEGLNSLA